MFVKQGWQGKSHSRTVIPSNMIMLVENNPQRVPHYRMTVRSLEALEFCVEEGQTKLEDCGR